MPEGIKWNPRIRVDKWGEDKTEWVKNKSGLLNPVAAEFIKLNVKPDATVDREGNLLTTAGLTRLTSLLTAGGTQALTNTSARIGVGDGAGTAAIGDTDLGAAAGSTHRWFQIMDATFPSAAGAVLTLKSTFATGDGNFAWNEWGIDVGAPTVTSANTVNALLLNHKTSAALGTKSAGTAWAFTVTVTFS
jgi:hypothetical protein